MESEILKINTKSFTGYRYASNINLNPRVKTRIYENSVAELFPFLREDNIKYISSCCFTSIDKNLFVNSSNEIVNKYPYLNLLPFTIWWVMYTSKELYYYPFEDSLYKDTDKLKLFSKEANKNLYIGELLRQNRLFLLNAAAKKCVYEYSDFVRTGKEDYIYYLEGDLYRIDV